MLKLKVSSNEFTIGFNKPQNIQNTKWKGVLYINIFNNINTANKIKNPCDVTENDIDKAPKIIQKQNLTCNNWIHHCNNIKMKKSKQKIKSMPTDFKRPQIPKFKPKPSKWYYLNV